jgi:hypothetical protein
MCPACISSVALAVAGATSTGAAAFVVRGFARIARRGTTQPPASKEEIRYDNDHEPKQTTENRLTR